jgi:hypothetical protein
MAIFQTALAQAVLGTKSPIAANEPKVAFQVHSTKIGQQFAGLCSEMLKGQGWELQGPARIPELGLAVNQVGYTKNGKKFYFQFSGSFNGKTPGLKRFNSFKQILGTSYLIRQFDKTPVIVMTSHKPNIFTAGDVATKVTTKKGLLKGVYGVFDGNDVANLKNIVDFE